MRNTLSRISLKKKKKKVGNEKKEKQVIETRQAPTMQNANELDIVAISMALYLHFDNQHEVEETGFWLNRPLNQQTTWTAKNNLFRKLPVRKY